MSQNDTTITKAETDAEVVDALELFALASVAIALDCTPGSDDDHLHHDFGVLAETFHDSPDERGTDLRLPDGRSFRISYKATLLGDADADVEGMTHQITMPANPATFARFRDRGNIVRPEQVVECSCKWAAGTMGDLAEAAKLAAAHLDPETRARDEEFSRRWEAIVGKGEEQMQPFADAVSNYAPLFPEVQHTGGGCMALLVRIGVPEPEKREQVAVLTDLDGPWTLGIYRNEEAWDNGEYGTGDLDVTELAPEGASPEAVASALVEALTVRKLLTAPVAREENVPSEWDRDREKAADRAEVVQGDVPDPRGDV